MTDILGKLLNHPEFQNQVHYKLKTFKPNVKILIQGKLYKCMYFIKSGTVRVAVKGIQGEDNCHLHPTINELVAGDLFGEFGLYEPEPACADIITVQETQVIEVDTNLFRDFLAKNPHIGYEVMLEMWKILVLRLRHANISIMKLYAWGIKNHHIDQYLS